VSKRPAGQWRSKLVRLRGSEPVTQCQSLTDSERESMAESLNG